ncbi:MAG: magnesium chelatase ATPase subunit D, partial [Pseudomonadota bacterium]
MSLGSDRWTRAVLALRCLALDPAGLGGIVIRARVGPARAAAINLLTGFPLPVARLTPSVSDDQLFGGVDIAATLAAGKLVETTGLLSRPVAVLLAMAERCDAGFAGRLAQHLDGAQDGCLILLDEGATPEERVPTSLTDRVAFFLDLDGLSLHDLDLPSLQGDPIDPNCVEAPPMAVADLTALALRFGIDSLRAPLLALRAARAHAALHGRSTVTADDITAAAALVYPSRATQVPEEPRDKDLAQEQEHPDNTEAPTDNPDPSDELLINAEMLVEAVRAQLPAGLLDQIKPRQTQAGHGAGTGDRRAGNRRGRPLPPRPGRLDGRARVDIVATLRAAAPWQPLRRRARPDAPGVLIRASDIRVRRFEERSDRLLIFAVDASGSAAISRLNEAKGAVELLLGEAYARRDHVALIAFRGAGADLLLPPTRSLVQTKRRLAALP